jgi:hypothetical protein
MTRQEFHDDTSFTMPASGPSSLSGRAVSIYERIAHRVLRDLYAMENVVGESACELDFARLADSAIHSLSQIERHIAQGRSMPWVKVKHSPDRSLAAPICREVQLGVFPVAANPFHWAHLLGGLLTMETFALDKIIFVVAGNDPRKSELAPMEARHAMARSLLRLFHPLFEYSSIALGGSSSGEENLFRILGMNPLQPIHAWYIAGGDHYHRYQPTTGNVDTLEKLEEGIARATNGFDRRFHRVSAVFLEREKAA